MSRNAEIERSFADDRETWHAIATIPGWERRVADALSEAGFAPYLPEVTQVVIRRGVALSHRRIVIPSYVFVKLALWADNSWTRIRPKDRFGGPSGAIVAGAIEIGQRVEDSGSRIQIQALGGIEGVIGLVKNGALPIAIPERQMNRLAKLEHLEDDIEPILAWLAKAGKITRVSNRKKKRELGFQRHLANLLAA